MNLAQAYAPPGEAVSLCQIHSKKNYEVNFYWNVLIGAPGRHLYQKIINPTKVLASVKLM